MEPGVLRSVGPGDDPVEDLPVGQLRFGYSPRDVSHDEQHVAALAERLPSLPPITVHASTMTVIDGVHRVRAARLVGQETIRGLLFHGDEEETRVHAIWSNVTHGKPLTLEERRAAARMLVASHPEWSDRRLASICGLSPKTIAQVRATGEPPRSRARVGRDGRSRPTDPAELRHRVAEAIRAHPTASNRSLAGTTGASPYTVADVRRRLARNDDVLPRSLQTRSPDGPAGDAAAGMHGDNAYVATESSRGLAAWFEAHLVSDDDWGPFVSAAPLSRVYELADSAGRCSQSWLRLASALEARSTGR